MQSPELWEFTKYEVDSRGLLRGSRNRRELSPASRLVADRVAGFYSRAIPRYSTGALLDLGCGKAPLYGLYRHYTSSTTCVDWGLSLHENPLLDREADLNGPLPFESETFDTVLLSDVLEHVVDPLLVMGEIARLLKPGGVLLMNVPFFYWLHETPHDYHRFTSYALRRMSSAVGLRVEELTSIGGAPEIISDMVAKHLIRVPRVGSSFAALLQWAVGNLTETKRGRRLSSRSGEKFPLGYTLIAVKPFTSL